MRSRKVITIAACLAVAWTFITYIFLLRSNSSSPSEYFNRRNFFKKLEALENGVEKEVSIQDNLIHSFVQNLKAKLHQKSGAELTSTTTEKNNEAEKKDALDNSNVKEIPLIAPGSYSLGGLFSDNKIVQTHLSSGEPIIPVIVFACNRVSVGKCLDNLIQYRPSIEQFPIIVSQDCGDEPTKKVILSYKEQVNLIEQPDQSEIFVLPKEKKFKGYYKIARHYGWALNTTFQKGYDFVIIVEDDLNVAPDFFEYFLGTHHLLKKDPTLWCVSAWNDNGKIGLIDTTKPELLFRTDFFPGLGWMLTKDLWNELSPKWPKSFWDDWIRHPEQRKKRVCIRPEISRTRTFGKFGVSNGLFFDKYLKHIKLSEEYVHFTKLNLSYLLQDFYDDKYIKMVYDSPIITYEELRRGLIKVDGPVRIQYNTKDQYKRTTKMLGLMDDFKSGVPRTAYHGIVSFYYNDRRVFLAPGANWKGYDLSWS